MYGRRDWKDAHPHLERQNAPNRIIDAGLGKLTTAEGGLQRTGSSGRPISGKRSNQHVVTGLDRQHCRLRLTPLFGDPRHVESVGHHHTIVPQLLLAGCP